MSESPEQTAAFLPTESQEGTEESPSFHKKLLKASIWLIVLGAVAVLANVLDIEETSSNISSLMNKSSTTKDSIKKKKHYYANTQKKNSTQKLPFTNTSTPPATPEVPTAENPATLDATNPPATPNPTNPPATPQPTEPVPPPPAPQTAEPAECEKLPAPADGTCAAANPSILDNGMKDSFAGWYSLNNDDCCQDYCRWVGNSRSGGDPKQQITFKESFWSCRPAGYTSCTYFENFGGGTTFNAVKCEGQGKKAQPTLAPAGPTMWIHVVHWAEGMAAWRVALEQMLQVAKAVNGIFVEPCVQAARLESCASFGGEGKGVRLGSMVDLDELKRFHPHIVSYDDFVRETSYNFAQPQGPQIHFACLDKTKRCEERGIKINSSYKSQSQPSLEAAYQASFNGMVIWEVVKYRKFAFNGLQINGQPVSVGSPTIRFPPAQYAKVEEMLETSLGIARGSRWAAIQWRPEIDPMDYTKCAEAILWTRDLVSHRDNIPESNFVLISPLSNNKGLQWGGVKKMADRNSNTSYPALDMLLNAGIKKLEQSFDQVYDGGLLAVWDFIMAETATVLSTCSGCKRGTCTRCNYQGASAGYVLGLRKTYQKRHPESKSATDQCWPV
ncbi:expressed unknown protein [Seminavis robusta]|uniref:Uncharacterized protein n=1 Tax=Seminavis robusta TaxID=568900 RepID=A0A9N8EVU4_9STRA|nr:expressed unknown protein [Seminavis robusta]|eukprot:Sro2169_g317340.1 n/a (614) ;mRNA; f:4633-6474